MFNADVIVDKLEASVDTEIDIEFSKYNVMKDFHTSDWLNEKYYKRHILESI